MSVPDDLLPQTIEEYEARFRLNFTMSGRGDNATAHLPCPFCASDEWLEVLVVEFRHSTDPIYCIECGRSARFQHSQDDYGVDKMELIHVAGPVTPPWMTIRSDVPDEGIERSRGFLDDVPDHNAKALPEATRPPGIVDPEL